MAAQTLEKLVHTRIVRSGLRFAGELLVAIALVIVAELIIPKILRNEAPSSDDLCGRVRAGMTVQEVEKATSSIEGWQILRHDGVMVVSALPRSDKRLLCRVHIDTQTHRVDGKKLGPLERGDIPSL